MDKISLASLPDDLILDISSELDTARDVAHLSLLSPKTRAVLRETGWRDFVRNSFPSYTLPNVSNLPWSLVANRLTYQESCWEKRAIVTRFFNLKSNLRQNRRPGRQSVLPHCVLDAKSIQGDGELLVWSAGEDVVTRVRSRQKGLHDSWKVIKGADFGYTSGFGDVTAVSVVDRGRSSDILLGRANGDLQLLSGGRKTLGKTRQRLMRLEDSAIQPPIPETLRNSPGSQAISWTEWNSDSKMLAVCRRSIVTLYNLRDMHKEEVRPVAYCNMFNPRSPTEASMFRGLKFLDSDTVVCGLGGTMYPLRWGKIRPEGLEFYTASHDDGLGQAMRQMGQALTEGAKTTVRAVERVGHPNNSNLALSAWDDGTYRLLDVRTPSCHDAIYRDNFQPYYSGSCLLVYGDVRFVAGSNAAGLDLRIFDFRFPKPYSHTTGLPCSSHLPRPERPGFTAIYDSSVKGADCDHVKGTQCRWHGLSRSDFWRPDATLYLSPDRVDGITSLAKASDTSDTFYCGTRGGTIENTLQLTEDVKPDDVTRSAPPGWQISTDRGSQRLMETGVSLTSTADWQATSTNPVPPILIQHSWAVLQDKIRGLKKKDLGRRLDIMYESRKEIAQSDIVDDSPEVWP